MSFYGNLSQDSLQPATPASLRSSLPLVLTSSTDSAVFAESLASAASLSYIESAAFGNMNLLCNFLGSRVKSLVVLLQLGVCDVRVDLGGRNICMAEHLLNRANVGAVLNEMGGKRMPQSVR